MTGVEAFAQFASLVAIFELFSTAVVKPIYEKFFVKGATLGLFFDLQKYVYNAPLVAYVLWSGSDIFAWAEFPINGYGVYITALLGFSGGPLIHTFWERLTGRKR